MKKLLGCVAFYIWSCAPLFAQFKIIAYLPNWMGNFPSTIHQVDLKKVTHINIAFANPNSNGTLTGISLAEVDTIVRVAHANNVKVLMSIGGAGAPASTYNSLLNNTTNMKSFVTKLVQYTVDNQLDGIDVDIEGDVLDGNSLSAAQYQSFIVELGAGLHGQGKIMTAALATWFGSYVSNTAAAQFDFINIMSYDAAIPGGSDPAGALAPYSMVTSDYQYWNTTKAVAKNKLTIGVPFYGYGWGTYAKASNDEYSYCEIVSKYTGAENNDMVGTGNNAIYYNGIPTIVKKTQFALQNASGIMIWEIMEDCSTSDNRSLLKAVYETVNAVTEVSDPSSNHISDIYPNPVSEELYIDLSKLVSPEESCELQLYDTKGILLHTLSTLDPQVRISMHKFQQGIYILKGKTPTGYTFTKRLEKK